MFHVVPRRREKIRLHSKPVNTGRPADPSPTCLTISARYHPRWKYVYFPFAIIALAVWGLVFCSSLVGERLGILPWVSNREEALRVAVDPYLLFAALGISLMLCSYRMLPGILRLLRAPIYSDVTFHKNEETNAFHYELKFRGRSRATGVFSASDLASVVCVHAREGKGGYVATNCSVYLLILLPDIPERDPIREIYEDGSVLVSDVDHSGFPSDRKSERTVIRLREFLGLPRHGELDGCDLDDAASRILKKRDEKRRQVQEKQAAKLALAEAKKAFNEKLRNKDQTP